MRVFDEMDRSGTGALAVSQLVEFVRQLTGCSDAQAGQFVTRADANRDGVVDRKEFVDMWSLMFG